MPYKIQYHDIARIQIETAIRLFHEENYICAITLAKAGEEFLGKHMGEDAASKQLLKEMLGKFQDAEKFLNKTANFLKHGNDPDYYKQDVNVKVEAIQYILRGVLNYALFARCLTSLMSEFQNEYSVEAIETLLQEAG